MSNFLLNQTNLSSHLLNKTLKSCKNAIIKEEKEVDDEHPQVNSTTKIANFSFILKIKTKRETFNRHKK